MPKMRSKKLRWLLATALAAGLIGLIAAAQRDARRSPELWGVEVIAAYPHDPYAFTQGLAIDRGRLYEGTGGYGASSLRRVDISTGRVERMIPLKDSYFGEGITVLDGRLYQLTWRSRIGIVYDVETFDVLESFRYAGEGWGLANDGTHLLVSDGTASIRFLDPHSFETVRTLTVREGGREVTRINELEYIREEIWANVWHEDRIARISPQDGTVRGWIDLGRLHPRSMRGPEEVLNGIAYDPAAERVFVTGKNWPRLYEIETVPR
jgi:glutamine cyclotransferase